MRKFLLRAGFLFGLLMLVSSPFVKPARSASLTADTAAELISAIETANINGEADTITLTADITLTAVYSGETGLPNITSEITIEGNGHTLETTGAFRSFYVDTTGDLTLNDITLSATTALPSDASGGLVYSTGDLSIYNSTLENGRTTGTNSFGGAVASLGGTLYLENSTLTNNRATSGGAVFVGGTAATITHCSLTGNTATTRGGALYVRNSASNLQMDNTTVDNNRANYGGGVYIYEGVATITQSAITNNTANYSGGALLQSSNANTVTITHTTVTGNTASYAVGGLLTDGVIVLDHVTVAGNTETGSSNYAANLLSEGSGSTITVRNSIIANPGSHSNCRGYSSGTIIDGGYNIEAESGGSYTCGFSGTSQTMTDAGLNALADNGGPTQTMALETTSAAIDMGTNCGMTDQRGYTRDTACDSGAFEYFVYTISGRVWLDADRDGLQDSMESGIAGLTVTLYPPTVTTTTDTGGFYSFTSPTVATGTAYSVGFATPANHVVTLQNVGGDDTIDSDADPATVRITNITLPASPPRHHEP